jgi:hypothetical protein
MWDDPVLSGNIEIINMITAVAPRRHRRFFCEKSTPSAPMCPALPLAENLGEEKATRPFTVPRARPKGASYPDISAQNHHPSALPAQTDAAGN